MAIEDRRLLEIITILIRFANHTRLRALEKILGPILFGTPWISLRFHFPPFFSDARAMLECRRLANVAWFPENGPLCLTTAQREGLRESRDAKSLRCLWFEFFDVRH